MRSFGDLPEDVALPPIEGLIAGRPTSWNGMALEWLSRREPVPVFMGLFVIPPAEIRAFLFGARYLVSEVLCDGETLGDGQGHFLEYFVVEATSAGGWVLHRLLQRASVAYSEDEEPDDYLPAREVDAARHSVQAPPQWKASEAEWPTHAGAPMKFLGQLELPDSEVTRSLLTWNESVYLFWTHADGANLFKLTEQHADLQTAEEHYEEDATR